MRILVLESNLLWTSKLRMSLNALGHESVISGAVPSELNFDVVVINLGSPPAGVQSPDDWRQLVANLREKGPRVVAHAGHKEHQLRELGRDIRCDVLATNGEMAHHLGRVLERAIRSQARVAITGGVAEGKSTVLQDLADLGQSTLSADSVAQEVYESESVQEFLRAEFVGTFERGDVRERLAGDTDFRHRLNALIHPEVARRLKGSQAQFVEVPLLVEAAMHPYFDQVWVVTCGEEEQLRRLEQRLGSRLQASALIRTQIPTRAKIPFADEVVRTNQPRETVRAYVQEAVARSKAQ